MLKRRLAAKHAPTPPGTLLRGSEQVHVPIRTLDNRFRAKRDQPMICYFEQGPSLIFQSLHKLKPVPAGLLQAIWPKFKEQFCVRVISQDTAGAAQRLQLITL